MAIQLVWFNLFSLLAGFGITLFFYRPKPRSLWFAPALAIALFVLFGVFAIPGFLLGLGALVLLKKPVEKPRLSNAIVRKARKGGKH